ncbi:MAG: DNA-3-methyladenine glycosylase family protein [Acidimicrobiales bacterium]
MELARTVRPVLPVDLRLTLFPLRRGRLDPAVRFGPEGVWRATRTPDGPVTTHLHAAPAEGTVTMRAWGPGAGWALDAFPALVGADDVEDGFVPGIGVVGDLHHRLRGLRIGRSKAVIEALVPSILEQKVVGLEARRSYARLVRALGEPAPMVAGVALTVPPAPEVLAATPSWTFHRFGVERKRADTIRLACSYAARLEETVDMSPDDARRRLTALPGIGPWTTAEVALVALGDADAVSVGDYHLPNQVAWALAGEPRGDDARMLELLEPWRGHRGRVLRLLGAGAGGAPRYGPRTPLRSIAGL